MAFVCAVFTVYYFVLLARVIFSFVTAFGGSVPPALAPVIRVVYDLTEPVMAPLRRVIPPIGGFDLSVLFVFIALRIVESALGCG